MASGGQGIESLVEESAVHFSTSFSEFLKITAKLEASGLDKLDYKGLAAISRNSLGEIEFCRDLYKELVNRAEQTPYNSVFIEKLKRFDYAAFTRGRGLNTPLYNKVRGFLVRGDLNGLLKLFSNKTETLTGLVAQVDHEISRTGCVTLESIWSVNDAFAELMLLEQYAARIFKSAN